MHMERRLASQTNRKHKLKPQGAIAAYLLAKIKGK